MENNTTQKRGLGRGLAALLGGDDEAPAAKVQTPVAATPAPTPATPVVPPVVATTPATPVPTQTVKSTSTIVEQKMPAVEVAVAEAAAAGTSPYRVLNLAVDKIKANEEQPRQHFADVKLQELAESICEQGLIQPIIVRRTPGSTDGQSYQIVAGERRWRACKMLGMAEIPAIIRDENEQAEKADLASIIENIQRVELNAVELADAYSKILKIYNFTQEELAKKLGVSRVSVANTLRLQKLPESIKEYVIQGKITEGHARALLTLESENDITALASEIIAQGLNVREVESKVREKIQGPAAVTTATKTNDPTPMVQQKEAAPKSAETLALEEELRSAFGTKVLVRGNAKGGVIELFYSNEDSLHRLLHQLRSAKNN